LVDLGSIIHLVDNELRIHVGPNLPRAPSACVNQSFDQGTILGHIIRRGTYCSRKSVDYMFTAIADLAEDNCNSSLTRRVPVPSLSRLIIPPSVFSR
jgi:hypothetical protein